MHYLTNKKLSNVTIIIAQDDYILYVICLQKKKVPATWLKKLEALIEYWKNSSNRFNLPFHYKDPQSGLNYKFFNHYVKNIVNLKINSNKQILLAQAIKNAKTRRTTIVNKINNQQEIHQQCSYMRDKSTDSRCKNIVKTGRRCRPHKKLSIEDLLTVGNYSLVSGRQRDYKSTCIYKKSNIPDAGYGVFATRHFYPGDLITFFSFSAIISSVHMPSLRGKLEYD